METLQNKNTFKFWLKPNRCWRSVVLLTHWRHYYFNRSPSQSCALADLLAVSVLKRWSLLIIYTPESFCCCYVPWINEESNVSAQLVSDQCTLASRLAERERSLNIWWRWGHREQRCWRRRRPREARQHENAFSQRFDEFTHILQLSRWFCSCLPTMINLFSFGLINAACGGSIRPSVIFNSYSQQRIAKGKKDYFCKILFVCFIWKKLSSHFKETTL